MQSLPSNFLSKFLQSLWLSVSARVILILAMQLFLLAAGAYQPLIHPIADLDRQQQILNSITIVLLWFSIPATWIGYKIAFGDWLRASFLKKFLIGFAAQFLIFHSINVLILSLAKEQVGLIRHRTIHGCSGSWEF